MKFIDYLKRCDVKKVCEFWDSNYKNLFEYDEFKSDFVPAYIDKLKGVEPVDTEFKILIQKEKMLGDEKNIVVNGIKEGEDKLYGLDFSPDAEWVGYEVTINDELKGMNTDEIVCHIVWEMSFYGNDETKEEQIAEIKRRSDEVDKWIKEGTIDQHTSTVEEVFNKLFKRYEDSKKEGI